jgi:hypothetical protein
MGTCGAMNVRVCDSSVREAACKAFAAYLNRCDSVHTHAAFFELFSKLEPHQHVLVDAYHAEGLLNLCQIVLLRLSSPRLLFYWSNFFPVLVSYLAHPASTVRQVYCASLRSGQFKQRDFAWLVWI